MDSAHIMLRLLSAERDADFDLHSDAVKSPPPPVYVAEMRQLETQKPDAYKQLQSGAFVVRRSPNRQFNCVPTDQALEQTVNREAKIHLTGTVPTSVINIVTGQVGCNTRSGGITIKTFAVMRKPLLTDKQKKLMCSTEVLFRRLLSVSNTTDIDIQKVLEHELAAIPPQFSTTMAQGEI